MMKNKDIWDAYEGLYEISQDTDLKFKATTSYLLAKNKKILEPVYETIAEVRQGLFQKYGEQTDDGWFIPNEKIEIFKNEYKALMDTETFINIEQIPIGAFDEERIGIRLMEKINNLIKYEK